MYLDAAINRATLNPARNITLDIFPLTGRTTYTIPPSTMMRATHNKPLLDPVRIIDIIPIPDNAKYITFFNITLLYNATTKQHATWITTSKAKKLASIICPRKLTGYTRPEYIPWARYSLNSRKAETQTDNPTSCINIFISYDV